MSSNDFVLIKKIKGGYEISHRDADSSDHSYDKPIKVKTALQALRKGQKIADETEYGITFIE